MKCPVCHYAKCRWIDLKPDLSKVTTERIQQVMDHNISYIEMTFRNHQGSAYAEERMYKQLEPYSIELERRKKDPKPITSKGRTKMATKKVNRPAKSVLARVITQMNYHCRHKQRLTKNWLLEKATGEVKPSSTVDKYVAHLKKEGYIEQHEGRQKAPYYMVKKLVPKDLKVS